MSGSNFTPRLVIGLPSDSVALESVGTRSVRQSNNAEAGPTCRIVMCDAAASKGHHLRVDTSRPVLMAKWRPTVIPCGATEHDISAAPGLDMGWKSMREAAGWRPGLAPVPE